MTDDQVEMMLILKFGTMRRAVLAWKLAIGDWTSQEIDVAARYSINYKVSEVPQTDFDAVANIGN